MSTKLLYNIPFRCGIVSCPQHQLITNKSALDKQVIPSLAGTVPSRGCMETKTTVWLLSDGPCSEDEINTAPLLAVIVPNPDPTGAQGACTGLGVSKDIIFQELQLAYRKPLRVAWIPMVRSYNLGKPMRRELTQAKVLPKAAVSFCSNYLKKDLELLKPDKILMCGAEVASTLLNQFDIPTLRRTYGLTYQNEGNLVPVQVTFNPYLAATVPVYIKSLREDCAKLFNAPPVPPKTSYRLLTDIDEVIDYLDFLEVFEDDIGFDVETENLNRKARNNIVTLQFATNNHKGVVVPYHHWQTPFGPQELLIIKKRLFRLFSRRIRSSGWIMHNGKFEHLLCDMHYGTMVNSADIYDTQAMAFLLDETRSERKADVPKDGGIYTLKQLAWDLLNFQGYDRGILKIRSEGSLADLPLTELADYGAMDAVITRCLKKRIIDLAREENYDETLLRFTRLFYGPITKLIAHIEKHGFKVDLKTLRKLSANNGPFEKRMEELRHKLKATEAFHEANKKLVDKHGKGTLGVMGTVPWILDFDKPDHQDLVFYKTMRLTPVSFSEKSGKPSIDDDFYTVYGSQPEKGIEGYLEVDLFYKYQETKKMRDTFITKMMERVDPQTGEDDARIDQRIRSNIHYSRLVTGRFAMTNPNLGQIPRADDKVTEGELAVRTAVKDLFTVDPMCALLQVDYKVNEVRWAAILAQDVELARIFNDAAKRVKAALESEDLNEIKLAEFFEDIHRNTASAAFGVEIEQVTKTQRTASKAITFGILFQQSAEALAEAIGVSVDKAIEFQQKFFAKMQGVERMIQTMKQQAQTMGYVEAPHGRRRRFWAFELPKSHPQQKQQMSRNLRQSVNAPIQGIASDSAMYGGACSLLEYIIENNKNWIIQNVVHDSCLVQVPKDEVAEAMLVMYSLFVEKAQVKMEELGVNFNLPLGIDVEVGIKWGSLEKWNGTKSQAYQIQNKIKQYWGDPIP